MQTVQNSTQTRRVLPRQGLFREGVSEEEGGMMTPRDVVDGAAREGTMMYVADKRVLPGLKQEFAFLSRECQAVLMGAIGSSAVPLLGADKPRSFLPTDSGACRRWSEGLRRRWAAQPRLGKIEWELHNESPEATHVANRRSTAYKELYWPSFG